MWANERRCRYEAGHDGPHGYDHTEPSPRADALPSPDAGGTTPLAPIQLDERTRDQLAHAQLFALANAGVSREQEIAELVRLGVLRPVRSPAASPPADSAEMVEKLHDAVARCALAGGTEERWVEVRAVRAEMFAHLAALHARVERGAKIEQAAELVSDAWGDIPPGCKAFENIIADLRAALSAPPSPHP